MKLLSLVLVLCTLAPVGAIGAPARVAHYGAVPAREPSERSEECHLMYYNYCSGWVQSWYCYCTGVFAYSVPVMYGTCFDLGDAPADCRSLEDVWYACWATGFYALVDIEICCADESDCPIGSPLAGIYGFSPSGVGWHRFPFEGFPLCPCEDTGGSKFIVMITDHMAGYESQPLSDMNDKNVEAGCEAVWRCAGHSYVYSNYVEYCDVYGAPAPLWVDGPDLGCVNYPTIPPGCHNLYWDSGYYAEWLIDCYVSCQGPTKTEEQSWSEIKALYR